jgi:hypothetical protein
VVYRAVWTRLKKQALSPRKKLPIEGMHVEKQDLAITLASFAPAEGSTSALAKALELDEDGCEQSSQRRIS